MKKKIRLVHACIEKKSQVVHVDLMRFKYDVGTFSRLLTNTICVWCYGRPLLHAWLLPDLNKIPNHCVRENSL